MNKQQKIELLENELHILENRILDLLKELQRKDNIINELKNYLEHKIEKWQDVSGVWIKAKVQEDKVILDKIKELENGNK